MKKSLSVAMAIVLGLMFIGTSFATVTPGEEYQCMSFFPSDMPFAFYVPEGGMDLATLSPAVDGMFLNFNGSTWQSFVLSGQPFFPAGAYACFPQGSTSSPWLKFELRGIVNQDQKPFMTFPISREGLSMLSFGLLEGILPDGAVYYYGIVAHGATITMDRLVTEVAAMGKVIAIAYSGGQDYGLLSKVAQSFGGTTLLGGQAFGLVIE